MDYRRFLWIYVVDNTRGINVPAQNPCGIIIPTPSCPRAYRSLTVCSDYVPLPPTLLAKTHPWNSCKLASTLVLLLATPKDADAMHAALRWQSRTLGGLPTMSVIKTTPSADLSARVAMAKQAAFNGKVPTCTVLGVSLVDGQMREWKEMKPWLKNFAVLATVEVSTSSPAKSFSWNLS